MTSLFRSFSSLATLLCLVIFTGCTGTLSPSENTTEGAIAFLKSCWKDSSLPQVREEICLLTNTCLTAEKASVYNAQVQIYNTCRDQAIAKGFTPSLVPGDYLPLLEEYVRGE